MDPFAMDFDDKEENKEMTDDNDFTDMTPEYMFQKFELVLFLLADITAYLITPLSQLRLQDKLNISDGSVFRIQQELGPVGGNDKRLVLYKMFVGLLQDVGMLKTCELLRSNDNRNRAQRDAMIDTMNKSQVQQMGKLVDFFLNSHTRLPANTIKLLSKNQEFVKAITENKVPVSMKKRIFKQKGGILPMLLPFAAKATAPLAGSLLSGIAGKLF